MRFVAGAIVGAVLMWAWMNRSAIGFVVNHRDQLDAAARLKDDLNALTGGALG